MTLTPRLDALPDAQRALWPELAPLPKRYVLYGGTALALRLAHRLSIDFDFFAHDPLDHHELEQAMPWLRQAQTLQEGANTKTVVTAGGVKVSFFGGIAIGRVGQPDDVGNGSVRVASLVDLAGTKVKALVQRVEAKDYIDIFALLEHGLTIETILGAGQALFRPAFNPLDAQKALSYFEGGDLDTLEGAIKQRLVAETARVISVTTLPLAAPRLD